LWLNCAEEQRLRLQNFELHSFAGYVAAKEAVMKAAGEGFRHGVRPRDIYLEWTSNGAPTATFFGKRYLISISHTDDYATAVALKDFSHE